MTKSIRSLVRGWIASGRLINGLRRFRLRLSISLGRRWGGNIRRLIRSISLLRCSSSRILMSTLINLKLPRLLRKISKITKCQPKWTKNKRNKSKSISSPLKTLSSSSEVSNRSFQYLLFLNFSFINANHSLICPYLYKKCKQIIINSTK